jgi:hypothetical protein
VIAVLGLIHMLLLLLVVARYQSHSSVGLLHSSARLSQHAGD